MSGEDESVLEQNKHLILRFFDEAWNQGRREVITEVFTKTAVLHSRNRDCHGPAEFLHFYDIMSAQFSQISIKPIVSLAEADLACVHWRLDCIHNSTRMPVCITGISICRIKDAHFVEAWQSWDAAGLVSQVPGFAIP